MAAPVEGIRSRSARFTKSDESDAPSDVFNFQQEFGDLVFIK